MHQLNTSDNTGLLSFDLIDLNLSLIPYAESHTDEASMLLNDNATSFAHLDLGIL